MNLGVVVFASIMVVGWLPVVASGGLVLERGHLMVPSGGMLGGRSH